MRQSIESRNETIACIEKIMRDINDITSDIKDQTKLQGNKMELVDEEMIGAYDNVEQANEQLEEKMTRENSGNKCLIWCVVIAIIVVLLLIFFGFIRRDKVVVEYENPTDGGDVGESGDPSTQ